MTSSINYQKILIFVELPQLFTAIVPKHYGKAPLLRKLLSYAKESYLISEESSTTLQLFVADSFVILEENP